MSYWLKSKQIRFVFMALSFVSVGIFLGTFVIKNVSADKSTSHYEKIGVLLKVLNYVENNYVEEVQVKDLTYGAIKGMLGTLDPHTNFLPPKLFKEMKVDTSGKFGGLGIEITIKNGVLTIIVPIEDTPAFRAGLEANDKIVKIEDEFTDKMTLIEAVSKMRGKKGTAVTIHVMREGLKEPKKYTIVRAIIKIQSIKNAILLDSDYGYVRIVNFQERTSKDLRKKLKKLDKNSMKRQVKLKKAKTGLKGIILDFRNNPGGLLDQAVRVSDLFLEKGVIVSTMGRHKENKDLEYAHKSGTWKNIPIVVLVNGSSASASEIVAGALQDHKRAVIVGTKTFGKGSVQQVIELPDKSGLKLTVARYYTPSGRSIQEKGLEPDIIVEQLDEEAFKKRMDEKEKKKSSWWREANLPRHFKGEKEEEDETKEPKSVIFTNDKFKYDFQLHQAYGFLKSYAIFKGIFEPDKAKTN